MTDSPAPRPDGDRVPIRRTAAQQAEEDRFLSVYGPWAPLHPGELADELAGFTRPWWLVGGWAIEAATGFRRQHEDTDISILACDVPAFVAHMSGRWHVWSNTDGVLRPLGERWMTVDEPRSQLWVRANATAPWVLDVPLTPDQAGSWTNKLLPGHVAPISDVTSVGADGIRYLHPEIVLLFKARLARPKDGPDFDATLPLLTRRQREWLRSALTVVVPDHPWRGRL